MPYTYPPPAPTFSGDTLQIHRLLQQPTLVAKRLQTLLMLRYISDALLPQRLRAAGGSVTWESGEPIGTGEAPRAVAPGAEYPLVSLTGGTPSVASTVKWGQDTEVTDESISRQTIQPVNRALTRLANQNVITVDGLAMSAITTAVTQTTAAGALWTAAGTTAAQILGEALQAKASLRALNMGFEPDTIVVNDATYAAVFAKFLAAGYFAREGENPLAKGEFPVVAGMRWLPTPNGIANQAVVADTSQLGGMADEDLGSPGYVAASAPGTTGVEVKVMRQDEEDRYRLRARRVTVPVILEPQAGWRLTGVS
jgi:hypothetical protein